MSERVVVVGAGVLGASVGFRLAEAGHRVTLIDPEPGGVASPGSFAWLNASFADDPVYNRLRHDSLELWRAMADEDPTVPVSFLGSLMWEQEHFDLAAVEEAHELLGRDVEPVDAATISERLPALRTVPDRALFLPGDGYGDPVAITSWFLDGAVAAGAQVVGGRTVEQILVEEGRVTGVRTEDGVIDADHVIVAAGIDLPAVLQPLDLDVPMENEPGLLARTSAGTSTIDTMLVSPGVHIWQRADGGYLIGADFGGGDAIEDPDRDAALVLAELRSVLAGTDECTVEAITVRERPKPRDGRPAIGPLGPTGLYIVSTHSGMTLAPLLGACVAREVGDGVADPRLAPYRPDRASLRS